MSDHPLTQLAAAGYDTSHIKVNLLGHDGNIFAIMGTCAKKMKRAKVPQIVIDQFVQEIQSSDSYDHAIQVVFRWFDVTAGCRCFGGCDDE